jgi:hypothetical protein
MCGQQAMIYMVKWLALVVVLALLIQHASVTMWIMKRFNIILSKLLYRAFKDEYFFGMSFWLSVVPHMHLNCEWLTPKIFQFLSLIFLGILLEKQAVAFPGTGITGMISTRRIQFWGVWPITVSCQFLLGHNNSILKKCNLVETDHG